MCIHDWLWEGENSWPAVCQIHPLRQSSRQGQAATWRQKPPRRRSAQEAVLAREASGGSAPRPRRRADAPDGAAAHAAEGRREKPTDRSGQDAEDSQGANMITVGEPGRPAIRTPPHTHPHPVSGGAARTCPPLWGCARTRFLRHQLHLWSELSSRGVHGLWAASRACQLDFGRPQLWIVRESNDRDGHHQRRRR